MVATVCRFCFSVILSNDNNYNYEIVDDIIRTLVDLLLLEMNLNVSNDPVICYECRDKLRKFFDFKSLCLTTEDRLTPFAIISGNNLNLREVYKQENSFILKALEIQLDDRDEVCRFCFEIAKFSCFSHLNETDSNVQHFRSTLDKYIPELDLALTKDVIICDSCYDSLEISIGYIKGWNDIEEIIKKYCEKEGFEQNSQIDLNDVKNQMEYSLACTDWYVIRVKNSNKPCDNEQWNEYYFGVGNLKLNVKGQDKEVDNSDGAIDNFSFEDAIGVSSPVPFQFTPVESKTIKRPIQSFPDLVNSAHFTKTYKNERIYKCRECLFETNKWKFLTRHRLIHKDKLDRITFKCETCSFETSHKKNLQRHRMIHKSKSEATVYKCDQCSFETIYKENIIKHHLNHKKPEELEMFKCHKCSYEAKRKAMLQVHMESHKNPEELRLFRCEACSYKTRFKSNLNKHIATQHSNGIEKLSKEKLYKCDRCRFKTERRYNLKRHVQTIHGNTNEVTLSLTKDFRKKNCHFV